MFLKYFASNPVTGIKEGNMTFSLTVGKESGQELGGEQNSPLAY